MFNSINKVWREQSGSHVVVCLEGRSWRKDFYEPYKRNRQAVISAKTEREQEEDAQEALNELMEDVETVIEDNSRLQYSDKMNNVYFTQQITVISIDTDEGVLDPLGVGEILIEVRY